MSQAAVILAYLQAGHSITPAQAYELCGTLALHSRIAELRKAGHQIDGRMITRGRKRWGEYYLRGVQIDLLRGAQPPGRAVASL